MSNPQAPKMAAAFIFDCSATMTLPQPFLPGASAYPRPKLAMSEARPIDVVKAFAKAKISQRVSSNIDH